MRCLLPLILLLGAAHAGPFFKLRLGAEHRSDPEGGPVLEDPPTEAFSQEMPDGSAAVFSLQVPKIDLSDLFKPLRVFAGVNVDHPMVIGVREEEPNCDLGKFELTDEEFDVVMDCQKLVGDDEVGLRECILTKLPKTTVELREFLDREEFGVASLRSSFHLALLNGEFTQKRSVQFRLCPRDEVNSIDGGEPVPVVEGMVPVVEEMVPMVEEMVPIEALSPDRVDMTEPEIVAPQPVAPPLFQFPALKLPDFGQIFTEAFAPVFQPQPAGEEGDASLGLFGSHLNPFAIRHPPAAAGPQQGFFASLFPALAATPPPQGPPDGIDMTDCSSKKFDVSRFVFNVANRCQYANDYRKCLQLDLADDKSAKDLLEFAADPSYSVIASSFSSFQTTFDLEALHSNKGVLDLTRKNQIDLRRCANIVQEEVPETTGAATEEAGSPSAPAPEAAEEASGVPEAAPEVTPEASPEVLSESVSKVAEAGPEEIPVVLTEYPSKAAPGAEVTPEVDPEGPQMTPEAVKAAPEVPVELTADAEKEAVEVQKAEKATAETEIVPAEAEKASVEVEKTPSETEKVPVETEKAPEKATAEVEKAAVEAEKAATNVENPSKESKPAQSKDSSQTGYAVAEP